MQHYWFGLAFLFYRALIFLFTTGSVHLHWEIDLVQKLSSHSIVLVEVQKKGKKIHDRMKIIIISKQNNIQNNPIYTNRIAYI